MSQSRKVFYMRLNYVKTLPQGYKSMLDLQNVVNESSLDHKLLELVKIRASQINGCAFCLDMHTKDARAIGETEQRIYMLNAWKESPFYSERERAALLWCETLTLVSNNGAPDEVYAKVDKIFNEKELVELTFAVITINSWNRLSIGFNVEAGEYVSKRTQ